MREPWRYIRTFLTSELIEYLRQMRKGTYNSHAGWELRREVYLQAQERSLISLPLNTPANDANSVPFDQLTVLDARINQDE